MGNALSTKVNSRMVFDFLFHNGDRSISEISERTSLSSPTVAKCLGQMIEKGLVRATGKMSTSKGRFPTIYGIDAGGMLLLGVETKTGSATIGLISARGDVIEKKEYPLSYENPGQALTMLTDKVNAFLDERPGAREKISYATFNISGRVNSDSGYSYSRYNFENEGQSLADMLSESIGIPSSIENDTRAMAYAENILGAGRFFSTYLYINVSSGIGISIISEGKIFRGRDGYSGELGHINMYDNNVICQCGKKGCLETEVSGRALCRKVKERLEKGDMTRLSAKVREGKSITENDIIDAALHEDPLAIEIIGNIGDELGRTIASLINIFNPEAVIIGGSLSRAGRFFLQPTLYGVTKYSLSRLCKNVTIKYSELTDAGIRGAGIIACGKYFNKIVI